MCGVPLFPMSREGGVWFGGIGHKHCVPCSLVSPEDGVIYIVGMPSIMYIYIWGACIWNSVWLAINIVSQGVQKAVVMLGAIGLGRPPPDVHRSIWQATDLVSNNSWKTMETVSPISWEARRYGSEWPAAHMVSQHSRQATALVCSILSKAGNLWCLFNTAGHGNYVRRAMIGPT